ncbi:MAG: hypothetical protein AB7P16_25725 [Bradyrhizobium sp.]|uniref:hypothetical protein n=1 Tax=Bradyrhizobium sp. TaxID=376 RepID=UPI003D0F3BE0
MDGDATPLIFKTTGRNRSIALALGAALCIGGMLMIMDDSGSLLGYGLSPRLRPSTAGWMVLGLGVIVVAAVFLGLLRDCPVLELSKHGIVYTRCLQGVTRIAWSEFDRVEVTRVIVPSSSGSDVELENIFVITTDGRRIAVAPVAPAEELRDAVARLAARFRQ